jgi:DNA modification methylase
LPKPGRHLADICTGSGTYLVSAIRTEHPFIGIERDAAHFQTACGRATQALEQRQGAKGHENA